MGAVINSIELNLPATNNLKDKGFMTHHGQIGLVDGGQNDVILAVTFANN